MTAELIRGPWQQRDINCSTTSTIPAGVISGRKSNLILWKHAGGLWAILLGVEGLKMDGNIMVFIISKVGQGAEKNRR